MTPTSPPSPRRRGAGFWFGLSVDLLASLILPPGACASAVLLLVGHSLGLAPWVDRLFGVAAPLAA